MSVEIPTDEQAMMPMIFSLRSRRPINQLAAAPARGAKIIKLRRLFSCTILSSYFVLCTLFFVHGPILSRYVQKESKLKVQSTKYKERSSKHHTIAVKVELEFHQTRFIHIQRFAVAEDSDNNS